MCKHKSSYNPLMLITIMQPKQIYKLNTDKSIKVVKL